MPKKKKQNVFKELKLPYPNLLLARCEIIHTLKKLEDFLDKIHELKLYVKDQKKICAEKEETHAVLVLNYIQINFLKHINDL